MTPLHERKIANAFFPSGTVDSRLGGVSGLATGWMTRRTGGLWVGGHIVVSMAGIAFQANGLNRSLHSGSTSVFIPRQALRALRWRFGILSGIVVVEHAAGEFRFRCYLARRLVARCLNAGLVPGS